MTRFATFWVEGGEIVAPANVLRFDDTAYQMLGSNLVDLTTEVETFLDPSSYGGRSCLLGPYMDDCRPEYVDHVATDFPDLTVVIQHGGRPYVRETIGVLYGSSTAGTCRRRSSGPTCGTTPPACSDCDVVVQSEAVDATSETGFVEPVASEVEGAGPDPLLVVVVSPAGGAIVGEAPPVSEGLVFEVVGSVASVVSSEPGAPGS